ncbi:hypothetical protein ACFQ3P_34040 [Paraburkholderia sabiae]|jgi:multisubunit Na+/H+ antiporter MnhF subunit|uniref:Uncharacterized protein n=1 Tax=Paraburkholderia sabiae TaxID=273251 RepID=A0ABU9QM73_9BURK|nr:hypothetical protein [Paraburkholderia sabiae]WJZ75728.1 hypothetical protein QEN71_08015 [Paraburkholderia sabiae]CAD6560462.1 hypothetical protein LMG24235_06939 [Paraburkholderia sabiae]CAG9214709.1 hypothetical protein PSAB6_310018 [Paraburkholderia sabiae]
MSIKKISANAVAVAIVFFVLSFPISRIVFTDEFNSFLNNALLRLGITYETEPGDSIVDAFLILSLLSSVTTVWLGNSLIKLLRRKRSNVE